MKNRDRRKAGDRPATGNVHPPQGVVMTMLPGMIHWCPKTGKNLGIVGKDVKRRLVVDLGNGRVLPMTDAEETAYWRWIWGGGR